MFSLSSIISFFKTHNFRGGLWYLYYHMLNGDEKVYFFELNRVNQLKDIQINKHLNIKGYKNPTINDEFFDQLASIKGKKKAIYDIKVINKKNDWLFIIYYDSNIAGWGIVTIGPQNHRGLKLTMNEFIIHSCITQNKYRRKRVYTTLLVKILQNMDNKNFSTGYITSKLFNSASILAIEKVGFSFLKIDKRGNFLKRLLNKIF